MGKILAQPKGFQALTTGNLPFEGILYCPQDIQLDVTDQYAHSETAVTFLAGYHFIKFKSVETIEGGKKAYLCHCKDEPGFIGWKD
ncbi:MAG: hypothetical protein WDO15_11360 [Bacteroidota bacterium]